MLLTSEQTVCFDQLYLFCKVTEGLERIPRRQVKSEK